MTTLALKGLSPHLTYLLRLADDQLILGHRLSEWAGHAPMLEEDIALANIALDHIGAARALYQHAATLHGDGLTEDDYAYRRDTRDYLNALLVERPNGDFAHTIVRQLLYSAFALPLWQALMTSSDTTLAAIAEKSEKEARYHVRHAGDWFVRLGDGTGESKARMDAAIAALWPYGGELFETDATLAAAIEAGVAADPAAIEPLWRDTIEAAFDESGLPLPDRPGRQTGGRSGRHTEHLGFLLAEMQHLQRAYPGQRW
ncbi:phenylacetate-CoA oxygenase subunit PaaC [Acuticoccus sp. M5D2P5]|uniref:1,2-phenylacetyl-CoA epoxidase subunit PaaC n=1 Tax=Acuticoccus kalidii TaxID=2910977 RepID=UPI001F2107F7|nr:1,2-phenylacetyl-CoA epoxidase subunit PaaC [Acuticoccus kalidii]MCF3935406.1 phenylacetate-CoA oxygenase subunit PaaC [Acuticoccus kalidii]